MRDPNPIRKSGPTKVCYDCDHELYPNGKIIFDDLFARQDSKERWHCSDCQLTDKRKNLVEIYRPYHTNTRPFVEYEDRKIRAWNQAAKKFGTGPYRKNKYTGRTPF